MIARRPDVVVDAAGLARFRSGESGQAPGFGDDGRENGGEGILFHKLSLVLFLLLSGGPARPRVAQGLVVLPACAFSQAAIPGN
jgi:hypothetical protein